MEKDVECFIHNFKRKMSNDYKKKFEKIIEKNEKYSIIIIVKSFCSDN